jgi:hypothetical protein
MYSQKQLEARECSEQQRVDRQIIIIESPFQPWLQNNSSVSKRLFYNYGWGIRVNRGR